MKILDTLITDRTQEDVERARTLCAKGWGNMTQAERTAFASGLKGAYGPSDMNRVVGAMEYIDRLMRDAKRESVYVPTIVPHAEFNGTSWRRWSDTVWVASDYPTPALWEAQLANIDRLWAAARRFEVIVLPRYDPNGKGYIKPGAPLSAGDMYQVTDSVGLMELRVTAVCPPSVTAEGTAWNVTQTGAGWVAALDYANCPWPDIGDALGALSISCGEDAIVDGTFALSATLRYDYEVTAGTCAVRWSPYILWGEAKELYQTWGGTEGLTWDLAARGYSKQYAPYVPAGSASYVTSDGDVYRVWRYENGSV